VSERPLDNVVAVVIGASAGGVEALGVLLPAFDAGCRAAVIVVVHLPRRRPSLLKDLFRTRCALPIFEAEDKLPIAPGAVYMAPPDYHLLIDRAEGSGPVLSLSFDDPVNYSRPSIDVLFESAAECWGPGLMGVILTGASNDGVHGLTAVARAGGITVVQDPAEAVADTLPAGVVRAGVAQHVLPLAEIGGLLSEVGVSV
jgi:two-component system chemotaxis response regulator CheB